MNTRIAQNQEIVGSFVVFDPTGRHLRSCLTVGRVESVHWDDADDGDLAGFPRPILTVVENGTEERYAVVRVDHVLTRDEWHDDPETSVVHAPSSTMRHVSGRVLVALAADLEELGLRLEADGDEDAETVARVAADLVALAEGTAVRA